MIEKGVLLINLGTPRSAELSDVRRYLCEFLTDKRVIDLPAPLRYLLVLGLIVPFRSKKSAHAYQSIWTEAGSPLLVYSEALAKQVQEHLGPNTQVALGMRYGTPSLVDALEQLKHCKSITVLPLYPHYSSAATGSSIEETIRLLMSWEVFPSLHIIRDFYQHPAYLLALSEIIRTYLQPDDYLLFSYHGIPERQIIKSGCSTVCNPICPIGTYKNPGCYKSQCHNTSYLLAEILGLSSEQYSTSFQSRLGKTPWIKPYTDEILTNLIEKGIKNIAIACPSFVTDCLETLEEIGMREQERWLALGGERFTLIPCLNTNELWIKAVVELVQSE